LKDTNFTEINKDLDLIKLNQKQIDNLEKLIEADSLFLKRNKLMDYSLLLVIEHVQIEKRYAKHSTVKIDSFHVQNCESRNIFQSKIRSKKVGDEELIYH